MKILVACEYSGVVRNAFTSRGHDAISCDLLPTEKPGRHYQGDIFDMLEEKWDLIIAHPPCTYLCVSGNRWYGRNKEGYDKRLCAVVWTEELWTRCIEVSDKVCFENPVGVLTSLSKLPTPQYIQPWQFGHTETKKTALFLYGLPYLSETENVYDEMMLLPKKERNRIHYLGGGKGHERSRTYEGIAQAMATQWGIE
jgi:hypothetical protein